MKYLLVDGYSIANRAFYGVPLLTNAGGEYTNVLYGFFATLMKECAAEAPEGVCVCFDEHAPTFRHELFKEYKGTRNKMPEELTSQIEPLKEMLKAGGCAVISRQGLEADDLIGSIAKQYSAKDDEIVVLSGDRDLLQLVDEHITLKIPKTKAGQTTVEVYDIPGVKEKYGVEPFGYLQMKALMGDTSDNIPGVAGIGEKTAGKLIGEYGTIENLIAHTDSMKEGKLKESLKNGVEDMRLSLKLSTIVTDADVSGVEIPAFDGTSFANPEFVRLCGRYELNKLIAKVGTEKRDASAGEESLRKTAGASDISADISENAPTERHFSGYTEHVAEDTEGLKAYLDSFVKAGTELSLVYEKEEKGTVLGLLAGKDICQLSFEKKNEQTSLFDEPEAGWAFEDAAKVLKPVMENADIAKNAYDTKLIHKLFMEQGVNVEGVKTDAFVAAYLLNPLKSENTEQALFDYYLRGSSVDEKYTGASLKLIMLSELAGALMSALEKSGSRKLYEEIELPLTEVLASMELEGIRVNKEQLSTFGDELARETKRLEGDIFRAAGEEFNIKSTKQLGEILFEKLGLTSGKKTKSGYSTSVEVLEGLRGEHEIIDLILSYRQMTKLLSTYVEGMGAFIGADGKIHTSFTQTVTATGRLSSVEPNLQNIPVRTELGKELRKVFVPKNRDYLFLDADYSQIELRILADMSGDENMMRAYNEGLDIHRATAASVLGKCPEDITPSERSAAKAVNFGIVYGISAHSLSLDLKISYSEAKKYIDNYYANYPGIKGYLEGCIAFARENGYAISAYGRRRPIPELKTANRVTQSFGERVARNMPIQGTAADIIKLAMIRVYQRLEAESLKSRILLQVHDELLLEVYRPEKERVSAILKTEMENAATLKVPLVAEVSEGENWYDAK